VIPSGEVAAIFEPEAIAQKINPFHAIPIQFALTGKVLTVQFIPSVDVAAELAESTEQNTDPFQAIEFQLTPITGIALKCTDQVIPSGEVKVALPLDTTQKTVPFQLIDVLNNDCGRVL